MQLTKLRNRLLVRETPLSLEHRGPQLVVLVAGCLLLGWWLNLSLLINGVELPALDWVKKGFGSLLDTLEESIVLSASLSSLLIRVVLEDLLAMSALDLLFSGLVSVFRKAENSIVILCLMKTVSTLLDH